MKSIFTILCLFTFITIQGQNTIGTITNSTGSYIGYTLFAPLTSNETYLINNCGEIVNQWSSDYFPGNSVYLLENGNLLRAARIPNASINFGGVGGKIQLFDWDGNLLWDYTHSSPMFTQHHDVYPMPNGNILIISAEIISGTDAIQAGRNPILMQDNQIYNERVLELQPLGTNQANIVWQWSFKEHLIQDFDSSKDNFGIVENNPQLLDFNYLNSPVSPANWLHVNSIQYNSELDQIILSSRILSEIYIIDHTTTTEGAASHSGGTYGKGGDFLYRWGNPEAYGKGTTEDRKLFGQHYPHWIEDGLEDAGKIILFNNRTLSSFSSIDIINPPQSTPGIYIYDPMNGYGPSNPEWQYIATNPPDFYSAILSSAQRLPNGNTLICDGDSGYFFEINSNETIVWEYLNPDTLNGILNQGQTPNSVNSVFRAIKYAPDYPAFDGKDLTPGLPIELNPDLSACESLGIEDYSVSDYKIYPNPTNNIVNVQSTFPIDKIEIYNTLGSLVNVVFNSNTVELNNAESGIYFMTVHSNNTMITKRIIKQ